MKRQYIVCLAVAIVLTGALGYLTRYTLKDIVESHVIYDEVSIYLVFPELSESEIKLDSDQARLVYGRIAGGQRCGGWYGVFYDNIGKHADLSGEIYVVPAWCDKAILWPVVWLFRNCMSAFYDPFNEVLVLSDTSIEPDWDCYEGVVVSNIPPTILNVDMAELRRIRTEKNLDWKYLMKTEKSVRHKETEGRLWGQSPIVSQE